MTDGSSKSSPTPPKRPQGAKEMRSRISSLEQEVSSLTSAKEASEDRAFGLTHRVATLEARERELSELLANRREQIARLETERDILNRLLGEERERLGLAEERERQLREVAGELRESLAALRGERDLFERRLEEKREPTQEQLEAERRASTLEGQLAEATEALEAATEQASRAESARDARRRDLERAEARYRRAHGRLEELQASRSYRIMRWLWRVNARIRDPFGRRRAKAEEKAEAPKKPAPAPARPAPKKPSADQAEKSREEQPQATPATEAPDSPEVRAQVSERRLEAAAQVPLEVSELRVAAIVDEISRACLDPDCDLLSFGSEGWEERLEVHQPHLLLVESAWQGNNGSWQYQVASYDHPDYVGLPALRKLIAWCRANGVPTVFWNKEDPVHFERFREAARLFDHVFTSDSNRIPDYEALDREGSGAVGSLQFAAQPRIHNPIAIGPRADSPCFAGAYYRDRHQDRRGSLEMLLDAARPFGLVIYDRTAGSEDDAFGFPERFRECIRGRLPYAEMVDAYKSHKVFLNVNSVTDSPTMLSRRVFELLACDTAVVSTESMGVSETFGDLVPIVESPEQASETIERLIGDDEFRRDLITRGRRHVLSDHTYRDRLASIATAAGYAVSEREADVAAVALVDEMPQARKMRELVADISAQSRPPAELLIGVGAERPLVGDLQQLSAGIPALRVRIVAQDNAASRQERYRELGALAESPWVAVLHPQHEYGEHHVRDLLLATGYTRAEVIGSASFELISGEGALRPELEGRFVELVHPHSALLRRDLVATRGWPDEPPAAWQALRSWFEQGVRFFSVASSEFRADAALGQPPRIAAAASSEVG